MSKRANVLLLIILTVQSLIFASVTPAFAQIPKPSIPEFFAKYIDTSYDVPASYSTDPYTGEKVLTEPAHHVNNGTIELWITNQQYTYSNGSTFHVFYLVQTKGHYEEKWVFATPTFNQYLLSPNSNDYGVFIETTPRQSESKYTVLSFSGVYPPLYPSYTNWTYHSGSQVDFEVQAVIGHDTKYFVPNPWLQYHPPYTGHYETGVIFDITSDWSSTQTLTIPASGSSSSNSSSPNPSDQTTDTASIGNSLTLQLAAIGAVVAIAIGAGLLVYFKKRKR